MGTPTTWRNLRPDIFARFNDDNKPTKTTLLLRLHQKIRKILTASKKNLTMTSNLSLPRLLFLKDLASQLFPLHRLTFLFRI